MVRVETVVLCVKVSMNLFGSWSRYFFHHLNNQSLQSLIRFSLAATSREVGYSAMHLKLLDNIVYGGTGTSKSLEMDLSPWDCPCLATILSDLLRQFSGFLSFLHAHCGTHSDTKQQKDSFSIFKLVEWVNFILQAPATTTGEFNSKVKENHLLEI